MRYEEYTHYKKTGIVPWYKASGVKRWYKTDPTWEQVECMQEAQVTVLVLGTVLGIAISILVYQLAIL